MRMTVLYYSRTGNTRTMADVIACGMQRVAGVETAVYALDRIDANFVKESYCVVLGTPTYLATMAAEVKVWLDKPHPELGLAGKVGGAFATQDYLHGGADIAIQAVLTHLMVKGMVAYSGGGAHGKPVIHLGPVALKDHWEEARETFLVYGERMAKKTTELFG